MSHIVILKISLINLKRSFLLKPVQFTLLLHFWLYKPSTALLHVETCSWHLYSLINMGLWTHASCTLFLWNSLSPQFRVSLFSKDMLLLGSLFSSLVAQMVKNMPVMRETRVWSLGWEDLLEQGVVTHSSILAWRIPMDRGSWQATIHGVRKSQTQLSD